jgi:phage terminase Nu1 subunit (DNA packaging protein)
MTDTVTTNELALVLDITDRQIHNLVAKEIFTRIGRGQFSLKKCVPAYIKFKLAHYEQRHTTGDLKEEQAKLTKLKAYREGLEIKRIEGELVYADGVRDVMQTWATMIRNRILSIMSQLKMRCPSVEDDAIKILTEIINELLIETSKDRMDDILRIKEKKDIDNEG